ncbi:MAG: imidazolonepropionase [Elusimicrobia bacterium]|nr:imidazolonepropionase [Elusimicrobiota bacterium]
MNKPGQSLLVSNIGQLLTMRLDKGSAGPKKGHQMGEIGLMGPDAAVVIQGQKILKAGLRRDLIKFLRRDSFHEIDAGGKVVTPGFVDSHTHALFASSRIRDFEMRAGGATYEQIAKEGGGIHRSVSALREADADFLTGRLEAWCRRAMEHGITTMEVKSGYGLDLENERKMLLVIRRAHSPVELISTFLGAHAVAKEFKGRQDQYVDLICEEMIPGLESLAVFCDVFCDQGYFSVEQTRRILKTARWHGYKLKLHAEQLHYTGAADLGASLKAVSLDHLDFLTPVRMNRLAKSDVVGTLVPGANFFLATGRYPAARDMIDRGMAVALATDFNPGTSPTVNMGLILSLAVTQMRMTPGEALMAATFNGACALDLGGRLGSLETGKQADLLLFDTGDYREIPYFFGVNMVIGVIKKGMVQRWGN